MLAYAGTALSQLGLRRNQEALETWNQLRQRPEGASMAILGLADQAMLEGRIADAKSLLGKGVAMDEKSGNKDGAAIKLVALADAHLLNGDKKEARKHADQAIRASQDNSILFLSGRILAEAGDSAAALNAAKFLSDKVQSAPQAHGKILEALVALDRSRPQGAIKHLREAREKRDMWLVRYYLGRAYLSNGSFVEADAEFENCLQRPGEATAVFRRESDHAHLPGRVLHQALAREGLKSPTYKELLNTFLSFKKSATEEVTVKEASDRLN